MFRLIHISDLHLSKISLSPRQFFSKRWIGNLNLLFVRKKLYQKKLLIKAINIINELKPDYMIVTGDFSSTSREKEFLLVKNQLDKLRIKKTNCFFIPGNHDMYTKKAQKKKRFYNYFPNPPSLFSLSLKKDCIEVFALKNNWVLILLDTTLTTSLLTSNGFFSQEIENRLIHVLNKLDKKTQIILANHFPFTKHISPRKVLQRGGRLRHVISQDPRITVYLHGHVHSQCFADLRASNLPILMDPGSLTNVKRGAFNIIDVYPDHFEVTPYFWQKNKWEETISRSFSLTH